jgi:O-antigen/teichoic acid export membrane protein
MLVDDTNGGEVEEPDSTKRERGRIRTLVRRWIPDEGFLKNASLLAGSTAIGRALLVAVSPLLTRLYTVDDFGILAVYGSLLSICSVAVALRYDIAVPLPERTDQAMNLLAFALSSVFLMSGVIGGGFWIFRDPISEVLNVPEFSPYIWLLPVGLLGVGAYRTLNYWAVRMKEYGVLGWTRITQSIAAAVSQVGLGILAVGPIGLIVGKVLGRTAGIGSLASLLKKEVTSLRRVQLRRMVALARRYSKFPVLSVPGALLNNAGLYVPTLFLSTIFGSTVTGWFALAERVLKAPVSLIGNATQQVYIGEASELARTDPDAMLDLFDDTSLKLLVIGLVPALLAFALGPWAFEFIFGDGWRTAGVYVRILSPMLLVRFVASPLSQTLNILEQQQVLMVWEALRLILIVGAFGGGYLLRLTDVQTMIFFSGVASVAYVAMYLMTRRVLRRTGSPLESSETEVG